jgi:hypothetical protein
MIINCRACGYQSRKYEVIDATTGLSMDDESVFWADDRTGEYHVYLRNSEGFCYVGEDGEVATEVRCKPIRIIEREDS